MQRMVDMTKGVDPEFIVITGDLIDEFYVTRNDLNVLINLIYQYISLLEIMNIIYQKELSRMLFLKQRFN